MTEVIIRDEIDIVKLIAEAKKLNFEKPHLVIIEPYDPRSTNQQKRLYWKWVDTIRKGTGEAKYVQDEMLRNAFLEPTYYKNSKGKDRQYIKHISELGKKEMSAYMDEVLINATKAGYVLEVPEDLHAN